MESVPVERAAGRRLATDIRDGRGRVLLASGTPLTPGLCATVLQRGYRTLNVSDGIADDLTPRDAVTAGTRALATRVAEDCLRRAERGEPLALRAVVSLVDVICKELAAAKGAAVELAALRAVSDYTYVHSVNVCVYSLLMGQGMALADLHLRALGVGAMLHDVGKVFCADLTLKDGPLDAEDWERMRRHPIDGFEILRKHPELHLYSAHIAFQHHERMDGSGYPRGLSGEAILPLARIVAVADTYDAVTADRPHANAQSPRDGMVVLRRGQTSLFDPACVAALMRRLAVYPTGTPVLLRDGTLAVVADQGGDPAAPLVRLVGRAGRRFARTEEVPATGERAVVEVLVDWPRWMREAAAG